MTGTTTVAIGSLSRYFDKHYDTAVTFVGCGMATGIMVMPLMTQFLLDVYGWRGTSLLLSGITFNAVVCSLVYIPSRNDGDYQQLLSASATEVEKKWYTYIWQSLDMHLFTDAWFVTMVLIMCGNGYSVTGWMIFIVPHGLDIGLSPYQASVVSTAGGIGNIIGVLSYPALCRVMSPKAQLYTSGFAMSVALALDPVASYVHSSYIGMMACSVVYSYFRSVTAASWLSTMNNTIDDTHMVNALGLSYAGYAFASIISGFSTGKVSMLISIVRVFVRSFVPPFVRSFVSSFVRSLVRSFVRSSVPPVRAYVRSFVKGIQGIFNKTST